MYPQINYSVRSPNYSERSRPPTILVYHATAGRKPGDFQRLTDNSVPLKQRVSVHWYVDKAGEVYSLVDEKYVAWHAGVSAWNGLSDINEYSVGIEIENLNDGRDPYPSVQIASAMALGADIIRRYNIAAINVVRHVDIAPGRKSDPRDADGFSWVTFQAALVRRGAADPAEERWAIAKRAGSAGVPAEQRGWGIYQRWYTSADRLGGFLGGIIYRRISPTQQAVILPCENGAVFGYDFNDEGGGFLRGIYSAAFL